MSILPPQRAISIFLVFAFAYFLSTLVRAITATLAPTLVAEFSLNARDLGLLAGGYFLGFAATQLPLGNWLDRFGPKKVVLWFLTIAVVGSVAFSQASSFAGLLAARVLIGVGVSACLMAPLTGYRRWFDPVNMMRSNSWMLMVGSLGMVASTLPVQWLISFTGWRSIFLGLAVLVALAMALIALKVPAWAETDAAAAAAVAAPGVAPGYAEVWRNPYFRKMVPLGFVNYGGMLAMQTLWAAPWMVKVAGYTPSQAAMGLFWINVGMLVTFFLWGTANPMLARKGYSAERLIRYGMPVSLGVLATIVIAGDAISAWASGIWLLFFVCSTLGSQMQPAVGMAFRPELAGRALSAFNLVIFAGVFTVQWGIGLLIDGFRSVGFEEIPSFQSALGVYGMCCLGAYLYFLAAKKP